ncbi:MAG TPA: dihydroorotase [Gammaproteobacteria bacterium]|nr:dihydroorotase [Gammaproteobacteria bacterium]
MKISILGGRLIDPANDIDRITDLHIAAGKVVAVGAPPVGFEAGQTIDAKGQVVCPGLVDLRASLREPGQEYKATIASETAAAARAGITTLVCPPDTDPVTDTPALVDLIRHRSSQAGFARVLSLGALTQNLDGQQLAEMGALKAAGCVGVSNAHRPVNSTQVMRRAMEYAASQDLPVFLHAEDASLANGGCAHEGAVSVRLGLPGIPDIAESIAVARELQLIEQTGVRAHFCQLSSERAARMIARAQHDGLPVTADVAAHQLFLTEMDIGFFDSQCHVRPPLRTQRDRDGLRAALARGTINAICSDHQPHDTDAKLAPFPSSEPGISALETLLPLTLRLVDEDLLSLPEAIACLTSKPARIIGQPSGLAVGERADVCIFDPGHYWELSAETLVSQGHNTPFLGWEFKGRVTHTLLAGHMVFGPKH